ncbi:hypothetical protein [Variovorax ginsengisoli]|uniref:1,2-dihydroxy-3-keto-5-methylthiopentene dioxygenase n=1 Tax=Variovorax ginsengisoli TaxID=363844 RepID=A0ABT9S4L7_9BURK|nr:hypothetical protein [Variovorax ginsengisoli]MDP9898711.1 1,2-dihydroxy-3-keto-5-methylthiopentene dioxygenase [Variovorax ginsengisoli]
MGVLVHFDHNANWGETRVCDELITRDLARAGIAWGRWDAATAIASDLSLHVLLAAPDGDLASLRERFGAHRIERIRLAPGDIGWKALRRHLRDEAVVAAAEVRCFVEGAGLFHIRTAHGFFGLLCEAGEWVALPAGTRYGFDAGDVPELDALRLFVEAPRPAARSTARNGLPLPLPPMDDFVDEVLRLTGHLAQTDS